MFQFPDARILIQPYSDHIGAFTFDLSPQLPEGDDITECSVKASLKGVDTTSQLIAGSSLSENKVLVYFDYPGDGYCGHHELQFKYTLQSGAKDEARFGYVVVKE